MKSLIWESGQIKSQNLPNHATYIRRGQLLRHQANCKFQVQQKSRKFNGIFEKPLS